MDTYFEVLRKYTEFKGRATRHEYWMFYLINVIIYVALWLATLMSSFTMSKIAILFMVVYIAYVVILILPNLAVTFRRLHDTNHSAWWLLISCIPLVGAIILIVFLATDSDEGENKYGPNPKVAPSVPTPIAPAAPVNEREAV